MRRLLLALLLLLPFSANAAVDAQIFVKATQLQGAAPWQVHFDAIRNSTSTNFSGFTEMSQRIVYHWDFGDPGAGNWARGPSKGSKNQDFGYVTGHVYDNPGVYTVTLTMWDPANNESDTATVQITVDDPDVTWAGSNTYCIAASSLPVAGSNGCPAGAQVQQNSDFSDAVNNFCDMDADVGVPKRCLFNRGDTFSSSGTITMRYTERMVGAYGTGAKPIVNKGTFILFDADDVGADLNRHWRVVDIFIQGNDLEPTGSDVAAFKIGGSSDWLREALIYRVEIEDNNGMCYSISGRDGQNNWRADNDTDSTSHRIAIVDSTCLRLNTSGAANRSMYAYSYVHGFWAGSAIGDWDGTGGHVLRAEQVNYSAFAHNDWGFNWGPNQVMLKMEAEVTGNNIEHCNGRFIFRDNNFIWSDTNSSTWGVTLHHQNPATTTDRDDHCTLDYLFEANYFKISSSSLSVAQSWVRAAHGPNLFRNNIFDFTNVGSGQPQPIGIVFTDHCESPCNPGDHTRGPQGSRAENNSYYGNFTYTNDFITTQDQNITTDGILSRSNAGYVTNCSGCSIFQDADGPGTNISDADSFQFPTDPYTLTPVRADFPEDFKLLNPTDPDDFGTESWAGIDFEGNCRTYGDSAIGAFEDPSRIITCPWAAGYQEPVQDRTRSPIGYNLERLNYYSGAIQFANLLRKGREWQEDNATGDACGASGSDASPLDSNYYPTTVGTDCNWTETLWPNRGTEAQWPLGEYTLHYDGAATMGASGTLVTAGGTNIADGGSFTVGSGAGPLLITVEPSTAPTGVRLYPPGGVCADRANPSDPSHIEAWSHCDTPDCAGGDCDDTVTCSGTYDTCVALDVAGEAFFAGGHTLYHPLWIERLGEVRGFRFMDWNNSNRRDPGTFAGLADFAHFSYERNRGSSGTDPTDVSPEAIVDLCNTLAPVECWINIGHYLGDVDAEATALFDFYRDNLDPDVRIIFELSNEVWNGSFEQGREMAALADARPDTEFDGDGCCNGSNCAPADPVVDIGKCADAYYGMRVYQLAELAAASFGGTSRFRFAFARQFANTLATQRSLDCDQHADLPAQSGIADCAEALANTGVDFVYALAPYWMDYADCTAATDQADLCSRNDTESTATFSSASWGNHDTLVNTTYGLGWPFWQYEGGHEIFDASFEVQLCMDWFSEEASCLEGEYESSFDKYRALVGTYPVEGFYHFNGSGNYQTTSGNGGAIPNPFAVRGGNYGAYPKESGLLRFIRSNDCWWSGCELQSVAPSYSIQGVGAAAGVRF